MRCEICGNNSTMNMVRVEQATDYGTEDVWVCADCYSEAEDEGFGNELDYAEPPLRVAVDKFQDHAVTWPRS